MANHYTVTTMRDKTDEKSSFKLYNGAITAGTIAGFLTQYAALKTAIDALCLGVLAKDMWVGDSTELDASLPASNYAQRENKLLVTYKGNTTEKIFTATLPTVDLALLTFTPGGKDAVSLTVGAEVIALIAAIEAMGRTPDDDTETIEVIGLRFVGRNI